MKNLRLSILIVVSSLAVPALAAPTLEEPSTGVKFAQSITVDGTGYKCLGAGVRKILFFKAYAVTYCLQAEKASRLVTGYIQSHHPKLGGEDLSDKLEEDATFFTTLAEASADKLVIMQLVRNISKDKIADAFRSSLGGVLPNEKVKKLIATIPGDAKDGQQILIYSRGNEVVIDIAGDAKRIDDELIAKKLWLVWLGKDSPTPTLKDSIARGAAAK